MTIYQLNKYLTCIIIKLHNYNMRQHIAYKIPHCKTNTKQNTLTEVGPKPWNTVIMKNHIDDCTSISIFQKAMKQYIWRTY